MSRFSKKPDEEFFDLFESALANVENAAGLLLKMLEEFPEANDAAREILICEQEGDRITQALIRLLRAGGRPPLTSSSTHRLAGAIDDVVDLIEQVSDSIILYKIEAPMDPSPALAKVLVDSTRQLGIAVGTMRSGNPMREAIIEVHRLENEGDRLSREAIAALFAGGVDPMVVIRWKDIFEHMEHAIDACESVAHALEGGSFGT